MRAKSTIKLLNMYREKPDYEKMSEVKIGPQRIEPDRKWFGNVRTVDQAALDKYRAGAEERKHDPYAFALS